MKKAVLALALALTVWGCAGLSRDYRLGQTAESNQRYDEAIQYYEKAAREHPNETAYRLALIRAKSASSMAHLAKARALAAAGKKKEAGAEYGIALFYDPRNVTIYNEMKALEAPPAKKEALSQDLIEPRVKLKAPAEKLNLSFRAPIDLRAIFDTLSKISGVSFVYDKDFRPMSLAVDLTGKDLEQAVSYLCATSQNFYRVIDEKTILISPDNFQKRLQYELVAIKTFYLSNINAQDVQNALMQVVKSPNKIPIIQVDKTMNSITIRDTPQVLALAGKLLRQWDKAKPEVIIGVEIMEVSRTRLKQVGLDFNTSSLGFRLTPSSSDSGSFISLNDLNLGKLSSYQIATPQAVLDFLESDDRTKFIAQPRIRGVNGEEIKYLVGQKVPIVNSTFTPIFAGGSNAQPITSFTWENIGIELTLKPRIHLEKDVTIEVSVKITALAGNSSIADIPIIATREIKNMLRLKDGETNLLAGLLRNEERKSIRGIFGLKDIPILGQLFSSDQTIIDQTDIVLTLTPHIVRSLSMTPEDSQALWVEPDSLAGLAAAAQGGQAEGGVPEQATETPQAEPGEMGADAVYISPASLEVPKDREFRVNVEVTTEKEINNMSLNVTFDSQVLKLKDIVEGGITKQLGEKAPFLKVVNQGSCSLGFSSPSLGAGFKGQGVLAVLVFQALAPGETSVEIASSSAMGISGQAVALDRGGAQVVVR